VKERAIGPARKCLLPALARQPLPNRVQAFLGGRKPVPLLEPSIRTEEPKVQNASESSAEAEADESEDVMRDGKVSAETSET